MPNSVPTYSFPSLFFSIVKRQVLSHNMNLENSPHLIIPNPTVLDMVYGHSPDDLGQFLMAGEEEQAKAFLAEKPDYWLQLLKDTLDFDAPKVRGINMF